VLDTSQCSANSQNAALKNTNRRSPVERQQRRKNKPIVAPASVMAPWRKIEAARQALED